MQRSITLKIIKPVDSNITWEEFGYLLRGLSLKVCRMSNFCMIHLLLHAMNLETELLNPRGHLYCYPHLAKEYPEVPSGIVCATETRASKLFRQTAAKVLRLERTLPRFRKNCSIPLPVAGYQILQDTNSDYFADIQLLSRKGAKEQTLPSRIRLAVADNWRDKTAKVVLQKMAAGQIKRGVAALFRTKNNWYISIPYVKEKTMTDVPFIKGLVMGITFGIHSVLVYGFNTSLKRGAIYGEEVLAHQARLRARRQNIQKQYSWSGRKGHGRSCALKPLRRLNEKEINYCSLINNRYAKWVVDIAVKARCGEIHLDAGTDTHSGKFKILLAQWPLYDLKDKIRQKSEAQGIQVTEYYLPNLRTRCSHCGQEQEDSGRKRSFCCKNCDYGATEKYGKSGHISSDYNAARNLASYQPVKTSQ